MPTFEKREIFRKYGKGLRKWDFAFFNFINDSGEDLGGGFIAEGLREYKSGVIREDNDDYTMMPPVVDPDFILRNTLATGTMESRGQW